MGYEYPLDTDFIAELQYLKTEQGGRRTPARSGYRPQLKFLFTDYETSGEQTFLNRSTVFPGETALAAIRIVSREFFFGQLLEAMPFEFREGKKIIGKGTIIQIINTDLRQPSSNS